MQGFIMGSFTLPLQNWALSLAWRASRDRLEVVGQWTAAWARKCVGFGWMDIAGRPHQAEQRRRPAMARARWHNLQRGGA